MSQWIEELEGWLLESDQKIIELEESKAQLEPQIEMEWKNTERVIQNMKELETKKEQEMLV